MFSTSNKSIINWSRLDKQTLVCGKEEKEWHKDIKINHMLLFVHAADV